MEMIRYLSDDDVPGRDGREETSEVGQAVGEAHEDSCEARRDVEVVDLEARVDAAVEADADGEDGHGQRRVAARERRRHQRHCGTVLT